MQARDVVSSGDKARKRGIPPGTVIAYMSHRTGHVKYKELDESAGWEKVPIRGGRYYRHKSSSKSKKSRRAAKA